MPTVVGVSSVVAGTTSATMSWPAAYSAVTDDVGIIFVECEGTDTLTAPSGWGQVVQSVLASGTTSKLTALWRRLIVGDTAPVIADPGDHINAQIIVVRGCVTSGNPWNQALASTETVSDTTISTPTVTTTVADCLILTAAGTGQDVSSTAGVTGWTNAALASLTERMDTWTLSGLGGGFAMASGQKAVAGAVGNTTATLSLAANFKTLMTIALTANAPSGPPPPPPRRSYQGYPYLTVQ